MFVIYVPSPLQETHIAIGLFLFDRQRRLLRHAFAQDWRGVRALDPSADLEMLAEVAGHFDRLIQEIPPKQKSSGGTTAAGGFYAQLSRMRVSQSGAIQISAPIEVVTAHPNQEFDRLFQEHIGGVRP